MRKSDSSYDPMAPAPRATDVGSGSGGNAPSGPMPFDNPERTDGTSRRRFNSIAEAWSQVHRPLPGERGGTDGGGNG